MKRLILDIHDYLSSRKSLAAALVVALLALCVISALRMEYDEDISSFLPQNEQSRMYSEVYSRLGTQDMLTVFFEGESRDDVADAMYAFRDIWAETDTTGIVEDISLSGEDVGVGEVFGFVRSNWPYFLNEADYERMDSLLSEPGYIAGAMAGNRASQYSFSSKIESEYMRSDPLKLFSPVLLRLREMAPESGFSTEDGLIFTDDGLGVVFFRSPFGASESDRNAGLVEILDEVKAKVMDLYPEVSVFSTGGPEVAVENASRIKKDSILALLVAGILISLVLWFSYRRLSDILWILASIAAGAVMAIGIIAAFKSSISIIILGIGCMIIGIAVNYPLHYIDHLKYQPDRRKALSEQVNPLLVGNITTVGAFLSLMLMKADALKDFGFVGAMMLVGTILFVLFFLPVFVSGTTERRGTIKLDFDRNINLSRKWRCAVFCVFVAVSCVFFFMGRKVGFDTDMHNINYMTEDQRRGFAIMEGNSGSAGESIYVVASGNDAESALQACEAIGLDGARSIATFVPSMSAQKEKLRMWREFWGRHGDVLEEMDKAAGKEGFAGTAFNPFRETVLRDWDVQPAGYFDVLLKSVGRSMYLDDGNDVKIVSYLDATDVEDCKDRLRAGLPEGAFCFSSSDLSYSFQEQLSGDFDRIGLICSLIVFVFLWLSFGSLGLTLISFLPLAVGWIWILGTMNLFGWQFNVVNVILASFIFGQGDDYTIFMTEGLMHEYATGKKILHSFKNAVALSALIMFIGIGALIVAKHPAMKSLAELTIAGMVIVVMMAYYLPPLLFRFFTGRKSGLPLTISNILATVYIFAVFLVAMLVLSVWTFFHFLRGDSEARKEKYRRVLQKTAQLALRFLPGCHYSVDNSVGEDFSRPAIYVCNHQSHFDVLALLALNPKLAMITNDWVWKSPFYGYLLHKADCLPSSDGLEANLERMRELIGKGYSIGIFPEGTRSETCDIQRFHRGAFLAARELQVDILPLYIHGFGYALRKKDFILRKADISLKVGKRIDWKQVGDNLMAFTRNMRHSFCEEYSTIRREKETASYNAEYVKYQYLYKGNEAMRECRQVLRTKIGEIDGMHEKQVVIKGSGYGAYALLLALTHPETEVIAYEADEDKFLTASRCVGVPSNLHHVNGEAPAEAEGKVIEL